MAAPLAIDHRGMTQAGLPVLLDLVAAGVKVKATGFGRVKMDIPKALESIAARNQAALMFGTDMPSARAARPLQPADIDLPPARSARIWRGWLCGKPPAPSIDEPIDGRR